jgi:death on curing protein
VKYLSPEQVLFIHDRVISETSGTHGVRDLELLKSAVARPQATFGGHDLYLDLFHKAAALMKSLINNRPFPDGNKRTSIASAGLFLRRNYLRLEVSQKELEKFTMGLAVKKISLEETALWFKTHSGDGQ